MPKIRFCPECHNNFSNFSYVTEREGNRLINYLVYTCQGCKNTERVKEIKEAAEGILFSQNNLNQLPDREIHADLCQDPTLPHTIKVECPNKDCNSNQGKAKRDVVFLHYNNEMKLAYICCVCESYWKV